MSNKSKALDRRKTEFVRENEFIVRAAYDGTDYGKMELKRRAIASGFAPSTDFLAFFRKQYNSL